MLSGQHRREQLVVPKCGTDRQRIPARLRRCMRHSIAQTVLVAEAYISYDDASATTLCMLKLIQQLAQCQALQWQMGHCNGAASPWVQQPITSCPPGRTLKSVFCVSHGSRAYMRHAKAEDDTVTAAEQ